MKGTIRNIFKRLTLCKLNFLNHKFKKYIVDYKEDNGMLKVYNSNGDYKYVNNNIANKVKLMEIIKCHKLEIENKVKYYDDKKDDYKAIILFSEIFVIFLAAMFLFSFFVGSYILFFVSVISFLISITLFVVNTYRTMLFREEVKRCKRVLNNEVILVEDNEIVGLFSDLMICIKDKFYDVVLKVISLIDNIKVKFN